MRQSSHTLEIILAVSKDEEIAGTNASNINIAFGLETIRMYCICFLELYIVEEEPNVV